MNYEIEAEYFGGQIFNSSGFLDERKLIDQIILALRCEGRIKRLCVNDKPVEREQYEGLIINSIFLLALQLIAEHLDLDLEQALDRFIRVSGKSERIIREEFLPKGAHLSQIKGAPERN